LGKNNTQAYIKRIHFGITLFGYLYDIEIAESDVLIIRKYSCSILRSK